ncbi:MAG: Rrf2 family transcriptional regulator [Clostridiales Family XIII bacterium]|jgi:Rrf2 family protein|nr:Rrf2 family transcriptional regulator [Clostridiales Family XIII bacterium]
MRISVKGRYALAAIIDIADESISGNNVSVNSIAAKLGISKIYLEQVFSQLKKADLLTSVKGPKGGYQLAKSPSQITAWDVLSTLEFTLTEKPEDTVGDKAPVIETVLHAYIFEPLDEIVRKQLSAITVRDLLEFVKTQTAESSFMLNM